MIEIPRIGIKVQQDFGLFFESLFFFSILEFVLHSISSYFKSYCDASKPGCPLTTR